MRTKIIFAVLVLGFALPVLAGKKGGKAKSESKVNKNAATKADYDALYQAGEIAGTVANLEAAGKNFTLRYTYEYLEPKASKAASGTARARQLQQLLNQQALILRTQNPYQRMLRLQRFIAQVQNLAAKSSGAKGGNLGNLYKVVKAQKDFDLQAGDNVVVRTMKLPVEYDDKGHVKEFTPAQLKEKKGKDKQAGYPGVWENVANGQVVLVRMAARKKALPAKPKFAKDKGPAKEQDKEIAELNKALIPEANRPVVARVVVLSEPASPNDPVGSDKKRKKEKKKK